MTGLYAFVHLRHIRVHRFYKTSMEIPFQLRPDLHFTVVQFTLGALEDNNSQVMKALRATEPCHRRSAFTKSEAIISNQGPGQGVDAGRLGFYRIVVALRVCLD